MNNYPYVDIAVLDTIRRPFAAGDALVIVSRDLSRVVWANGSGLELFGLGHLDDALDGEAALDMIQRRQIAGSVPSDTRERTVHLRFVQGPQSLLLPVHISLIALPDAVEAVLLRIPFAALESRATTADPLEAIRNAGSHAAFIKPGARLVSGADDLAGLSIDPDDLARMMREAAGENDRLVKRPLRTARGVLPAALVRLTDENGLHLLVVIEPDDSVAAAEVHEGSATDLQSTKVDDAGGSDISEPSAMPDTGDAAGTDQNPEPDMTAPENAGPDTSGTPDVTDTTDDAVDHVDDNLVDVAAATAPVRFAWKTDAGGRFSDMSEAFLTLVGLEAHDVIGRTFRTLVDVLGIDDQNKVAGLFDRQTMWSGRHVLWPVAGTDVAIPVELAGLPVFARDRVFEGFRGFGIARPELAQAFKAMKSRPETSQDSADQDSADQGSADQDSVDQDFADQDFEDNVVPFGRRTTQPVISQAIAPLETHEREAFAEIGARLRDEPGVSGDSEPLALRVESGDIATQAAPAPLADVPQDNASVFNKLPLPVLVYSGEALHFANSAFFELSGYASLAAIHAAGGLDVLFGGRSKTDRQDDEEQTTGMHLTRADGSNLAVNAHLQSVPWGEGRALMLALAPRGTADDMDLAVNPFSESDTGPEMAVAQQQIEELTAILDTATDGVVVLDAKGNIRSLNHAAQALFGYEEAEIAGQPLNALLAIESHRAANDYMSGLMENGVASVLNDGRDMIGREREGRFIPIFVNIARLSSSEGFCAVIRDITNWKRAEEELNSARRDAEEASTNKTEFLAQISHEIRTPLNAIIGFSDVMVHERFGPLGNERYKEYAKDIHRSGNLVLSLVNDLLDISKIEAGGQSFDFRAVALNTIVDEAVSMMQPQANQARVLIRTSYGYDLPQLVADERSIKQIVLNLVSNAIRFTDAGGQVIVSTNYEQNGDITLKVRDTGIGMSENELEDALRPYRQIGQKPESESGGTGLGLPLARALAESNKGDFRIRSTPGEGTVIEIAFPASRVLAG
jgi:PAS domain S-box-containing protein